MRNLKLISTVAALSIAAMTSCMADNVKVKTRLDHLSGTPYVVVISTIPSEITSITCEEWTMLGVGSWRGHNEFSIPSAGNGVAIAILDSTGFDGHCKEAGSIRAHTDDGDFEGVLDRGAGNWNASTKLTFSTK